MPAPDNKAVRAHLDKILASSGFARADRLCRFLRFTVEAKLSGKEDQIKESVLGREVFDRGAAYDPGADPIVRVEARRLRTKLDEYYHALGDSDVVQIEFPKGSYVPVIHSRAAGLRTETPTSAARWREIGIWIAGILVLAGFCAAGYRFLRPAHTDVVAVMPASWLWGETAENPSFDESLAERVSIELANQRVARVVGWPLMMRYRDGRQEFRQIATQLGATKVLLIRSRNHSTAVFNLDGVSGQKLGFEEYSWESSLTGDGQSKLARTIVRGFVARQDPAGRRN